MGLPNALIEEYWQAITIIEARSSLVALTESDYPNLKQGNRDKIHRELYKKAYPAYLNAKTFDVEEFFKRKDAV